MDTEFKGKKFKLVGFEVRQKGTLIDVFAKFAKLDQSLVDVTAPVNAQDIIDEIEKNHIPKKDHLLDGPDMPSWHKILPSSLSANEILEALVGPKDLNINTRQMRMKSIFGDSDIIDDLGKEKLALLLIEMGKAKNKAVEEGISQVIPLEKKQPKQKRAGIRVGG